MIGYWALSVAFGKHKWILKDLLSEMEYWMPIVPCFEWFGFQFLRFSIDSGRHVGCA